MKDTIDNIKEHKDVYYLESSQSSLIPFNTGQFTSLLPRYLMCCLLLFLGLLCYFASPRGIDLIIQFHNMFSSTSTRGSSGYFASPSTAPTSFSTQNSIPRDRGTTINPPIPAPRTAPRKRRVSPLLRNTRDKKSSPLPIVSRRNTPLSGGESKKRKSTKSSSRDRSYEDGSPSDPTPRTKLNVEDLDLTKSYVGIVDICSIAECSEKPRRWKHRGPEPLTDERRLPQGWTSEEPDLDIKCVTNCS